MSHPVDLFNYILLALSMTHFVWVLVDSELMSTYRSWVSSFGPLFSYMVNCVMCTTTQVALLFTWIAGGPVFPYHNGLWFIISYLATALLVAKLSLVMGSALEMLNYLATLCLSIVQYLDHPWPQEPIGSTDPIEQPDLNSHETHGGSDPH